MPQDLDIQIEVFHHAADHHQLLVIFLAEDRKIGFDDIEKLVDHGGHPAEMSRSGTAAQLLGKALDAHIGGIAFGIHLGVIRRKDAFHPHIGSQFHVAFKITRILVEVLVHAELGRIDKDADDEMITGAAAHHHQVQMTAVQVTHGGHEGNGLAPGLDGAYIFLHFDNTVNNPHKFLSSRRYFQAPGRCRHAPHRHRRPAHRGLHQRVRYNV